MLAIDRLKRITSASKRLSTIEPRRASIEMLEPPPPAPPIGRWSGEISALPPHMYEGGLGMGAKPKKSPSGDSISTTGSGGSGSNSSQGSGEVRAIPLPREDAGIAGGMPYSRQNSSTSTSSGNYSDVVAIQVKRQGRSSMSEDSAKEVGGQPVIYQSFQGPSSGKGGPGEFPVTHPMSTSDPGVGIQVAPKVHPKPKPVAKVVTKTKRTSREYSPDAEMEKHESENNSDGNKTAPVMSSNVAAVAAMMERTGEVYTGGTLKRGAGSGAGHGGGQLRVETREHIYDQPQVSPKASNAPPSPKPLVMPKPASPLHVATHHNPSVPSSGSPTGRSKKAPPPPPKRTHSIRNDAAPPVVSKAEPANMFSVTTTASVASSAPSSSSTRKTSSTSNSPAHTSTTTTTTTAAKPEPAVAEKPEKPQLQAQAFASCVKSLSERFGSKKSEIEGSQESLSSDSDDFPPPPPPIAMDIITPKIHNYGIPSKTDAHHTPPHVRDYSAHSHHPVPPHSKDYSFQSRLKTLQTSDGGPVRSEQHSLVTSGPPLKRISPGRDIPATSMPQDRAKTTETGLISSNLGDKRSESTTSFESTTSSSSTDSNTLPFANENVGTIKQRAAAVKPSIVQAFDAEDGQRNIDLNLAVFDNSLCESSGVNASSVNRTNPSGASVEGSAGVAAKTGVNPHSVGHHTTDSAGNATGVNPHSAGHHKTDSAGSAAGVNPHSIGYHRTDSAGSVSGAVNKRLVGPIGPHKSMAPSIPPNKASAVSRLAATAPAHLRLSQQNNHGASSEGNEQQVALLSLSLSLQENNMIL